MEKDKIKIILASDHAGFELKENTKKMLNEKGYSVLDVGAHSLIPEDDYPVYISSAALKVAEDLENYTKAIVFGGSGQGEAIMANRFPNVRAVVWYGGGKPDQDIDIIKLSRIHNDANILSIGARFVTTDEAKEAINNWLETPFSKEERHIRRNRLIDSIE